MDHMIRQRVLSGVQASGRLHLGNYHGAFETWVTLQDTYECFFFIADWHALTALVTEPGKIREYTREAAIDLLACGLDPEKCTLFVQSEVPQHAEKTLPAITSGNKSDFIGVLEKRLEDGSTSQAARLKKIIKTAANR